MTGRSAARMVEEAIRLAQRERQALLTGQYGVMTATLARREALMLRLSEMGSEVLQPFRDRISYLQTLSRRNGALAQAAGQGVAEARKKLEGAAAARASFSTYTPSGSVETRQAPTNRTLSRS